MLLALGCGGSAPKGERMIVEGKVLVDGKPMGGVSLTFYEPKAIAAAGIVTSKEDGSFEIMFNSQAGDGNYKVTASKWETKKGAKMTTSEGIDIEQLKMSGAAVSALPERYATLDKTDLSVVLTVGKNQKDLNLKSK